MSKRSTTALAVAAAVLAMAVTVAAAGDAFTVRFGASGALDIPLEGAPDDVLLLGQRADALTGYDNHDVPLPPALPGQWVPSLSFQGTDPQAGRCWHDFRPIAASQTWEIDLDGMSAANTVTLRWRLDDGSLNGAPLRLLDRFSGAVLVPDMLSTTSLTLAGRDRALLVAYGSGNLPPAALPDTTFMLDSDGAASIFFPTLLGNDYDPDAVDNPNAVWVADVGAPALLGMTAGPPGASAYGAATLDVANGCIVYALPSPRPPDWTGLVAFSYTARDSAVPSPGEDKGIVTVTAAPHVVVTPSSGRLEVTPGGTVQLVYTLRHSGGLQSLALEYLLPLTGAGGSVGFWQFLGGYSDDAADSADPVMDAGYGPDGVPGTADDTGVVCLDFGSAIPPSGTELRFQVQAPSSTPREARLSAMARYRLSSAPAVEIKQFLGDAVMIKSTATYTVTYLAGPGGGLSGDTSQTIEPGGTGTPVEALANAGLHFLRWLKDGAAFSTANPLVVAGVTADMTLSAEFGYEVTFIAGPGGTVSGDVLQRVPVGAATTPVTAVPEPGTDYRFLRWTCGDEVYSIANPLTVTNVTEDLSVTARFEHSDHTVTFAAGEHGRIVGTNPQTVPHGGDTTPVTAVGDLLYVFDQWSDGSEQNPRTLVNVTTDLTVTALFRPADLASPVPPNGTFIAVVDAAAVGRACGWWDLTGIYATTVKGNPLTLSLVHDATGKLTGTAVYSVAKDAVVAMPIRGAVKGNRGSIMMKGAMKGEDTTRTVQVSLTLDLTVATTSRQLVGQLTGTIEQDGTTPVNDDITLAIPGDMDGTWTVQLQLIEAERKVSGTALLRLSNGVIHTFVASGRADRYTTMLTLSGTPTDAASRSFTIRTVITPMEGGWARIESFSGRGYGQTVGW